MPKKITKTVIERFLLPLPQWQAGYQRFITYFKSPSVFLCVCDDMGPRLIKLDRKGAVGQFHLKSIASNKTVTALMRFAYEKVRGDVKPDQFPMLIKTAGGIRGYAFALPHFGRIKGVLLVTAKQTDWEALLGYCGLFTDFLASQVELAYKNFELNNFYETVHPRALALSTMHSVHRVISSSLRLQDLLPRIGRLSAQVLKSKGCSIMLVDPEREYLDPYFSFGQNPRFVHVHRIKIGRGLLGRMAETGEYHLNRNSIAVPFIEDDVVGVIALWDKIDSQPFTRIDTEILKSLSEQAVVAIKSAQLFEETEQLTLGSIKTINELLELNYGGDRSQLPVFGEIVKEMGKDLELSTKERLYLERAIFLLDTGTLAFPGQFWHKKGKLTENELAQIRLIPSRGADILRSISSLQPVIPIILHQHERYDGKGYPQGLIGEEIPIGARIVSVVNSFIAMVSKRSYRSQMGIEDALMEIETNKGTQFDPKVVESFMRIMRRREIYNKVKRAKKSSLREKPLPISPHER